MSWHSAALAGIDRVTNDEPQVGWFKRKLVKHGVMVPARIWLFQDVDPETGELADDEQLQCEVNGAFADPYDAWGWLCGTPITELEFRYLTARMEFASRHEPDDAFASPRKPVDLLTIPPLF